MPKLPIFSTAPAEQLTLLWTQMYRVTTYRYINLCVCSLHQEDTAGLYRRYVKQEIHGSMAFQIKRLQKTGHL